MTSAGPRGPAEEAKGAVATGELGALEERARAHHAAGRLLEALHDFDRVIASGAAGARTWLGVGDALCAAGEYAQSLGAYERAIELDAGDAEARYQLGRALYRLGHVDRAVERLYEAAERCETIQPWLGLATILPGAPSADPEGILRARRTFAERLTRTAPEACLRTSGSTRRRRGRLRVGYVCASFDRAHYMKPVWGLINRHDRTAVEVHLFADCEGAAPWRGYRPHTTDTVHRTADVDVADLPAVIDDARIDVLVDLNGYGAPGRLPLWLARRAPRTVTWFNMYAASGLPGFDVIVGDEVVMPPDRDDTLPERVHRLPTSYLTFQPDVDAPPVAPSPSGTDGGFVFGSLAPLYKLTDPVVDTWSRVLRRAPQARLLLAGTALGSGQNRAHLRARFEERGIDAERLILHGPADHAEFLRYYDRIDLSLDTTPYSGGTTTMESLWQGVPVLTVRGARWAARISASLLRSAGLDAFVHRNAADMVDAAVRFATDAQCRRELAARRNVLRDHVARAPVTDTAGLARAMEALYRAG